MFCPSGPLRSWGGIPGFDRLKTYDRVREGRHETFSTCAGSATYYTGDPAGTNLFNNQMDEMALYSASQVVDFISWNAAESGYVPGQAHDDAVAAGAWTAGNFLRTDRLAHTAGERYREVSSGSSIGRGIDFTPRELPQGFDANGGKNAKDITPGRPNLDDLRFVDEPSGPAPGEKLWTVMFYLNGDNGMERDLFRNITQIEDAGGSDDFRFHDDPTDNVERLIADEGAATFRMFNDQNLMDLHHFAELINSDQTIPACYKGQLGALLPLSARQGMVVLAEEHGDLSEHANGLTLYMPLKRTLPFPIPANAKRYDNPYDYPYVSRVSDGDSLQAMYAPNNDAIPLMAKDPESGAALAAPAQWPLIPTPNFRFPADTHWDEFLLRFYHPVADNHILFAIDPDGNLIFPTIIYPECGNPMDEITVWVGSEVFFSGQGSSDADTPNQLPLHWMWDFDHATSGCIACVAPYDRALDGLDAAGADDDVDADHTIDRTLTNHEKEDDAPLTSHVFNQAGIYLVTLNVWDDNHTFNFHNTMPDARFVHIQSSSHVADAPELNRTVEALGNASMQFWTGVSDQRDGVMINNGKPGLNHLTVWVNDHSFEVHNLADRQSITVDISQALQPGNQNTITVGSAGNSMGDAQVVLGRKSEGPKGKSRIGVLAR